MTLYETLDLVAENHARIDVLWNFFIWIHLAVIGGLMLLPRRVSLIERLIVIAAYAAFAYVNRGALLDAYAYQDVLLAEVTRLKLPPGDTGRLVIEHLAQFVLRQRIIWLPYAHPVAAAIVTIGILAANRFSVSRSAKPAGAPAKA